MDILDDMGVSKLSAKVFFFFFKVNYSFNCFEKQWQQTNIIIFILVMPLANISHAKTSYLEKYMQPQMESTGRQSISNDAL